MKPWRPFVGSKCEYCGTVFGLTVDHIIPQSKGGKNEESNYQTLCKECNVLKGDSYPFTKVDYDVKSNYWLFKEYPGSSTKPPKESAYNISELLKI